MIVKFVVWKKQINKLKKNIQIDLFWTHVGVWDLCKSSYPQFWFLWFFILFILHHVQRSEFLGFNKQYQKRSGWFDAKIQLISVDAEKRELFCFRYLLVWVQISSTIRCIKVVSCAIGKIGTNRYEGAITFWDCLMTF